jgi:hypothetical protein
MVTSPASLLSKSSGILRAPQCGFSFFFNRAIVASTCRRQLCDLARLLKGGSQDTSRVRFMLPALVRARFSRQRNRKGNHRQSAKLILPHPSCRVASRPPTKCLALAEKTPNLARNWFQCGTFPDGATARPSRKLPQNQRFLNKV